MFVDSSVFVAILADEDDAENLLNRLQHGREATTSGLVMLESAMRMSSKLGVHPLEALTELEALINEAGIEVMAIEAQHGRLAIEAFARFGKGRGHPAQLNLSDCLSYACAKGRGVRLLYKGKDFTHTDLG